MSISIKPINPVYAFQKAIRSLRIENDLNKSILNMAFAEEEANILKLNGKEKYYQTQLKIESSKFDKYCDIVDKQNLKRSFDTILDDNFEKKLPYQMNEYNKKGKLIRETLINPKTQEPVAIKEFKKNNKYDIYKYVNGELNSVKIDVEANGKKADGYFICSPVKTKEKYYRDVNFSYNGMDFKEAFIKNGISDTRYYKNGEVDIEGHIAKADLGVDLEKTTAAYFNIKDSKKISENQIITYNFGKENEKSYLKTII